MKKLIFLFAFLFCLSSYAQNQDSLNAVFPKNTIFLDILGQGTLSLNYDRVFYQKYRTKLSCRVGLTVLPVVNANQVDSGVYQVFFPLQFNIMQGIRKHFVELSVGITPAWIKAPVYVRSQVGATKQELSWQSQYSIQLNYRKQSRKGLFFRIGVHFFSMSFPLFNPYASNRPRVINELGKSNWYVLPCIAFGKSFGKK